MGNMAAFDSHIDMLFSKYQEPADIFLRSVGHIQRCCREQNDNSLAIEIGNRALSINSSHENAIWVCQELALSYLDLGIENEADAIFNKMFESFVDHPAFAQIINSIADTCRDKKNYSKSIDLYQRILAQNPVAERKLEALSGIARASVWMGQMSPSVNYPEVDAIVQTLMTDYRNVERLGFHVFMIGEEYYLRGDDALSRKEHQAAESFYSKAFEIWQNNIDQIDDSRHRCLAYYYSAVIYQNMGDYEHAMAFYQQVAAGWPGYEKAWHARYMTAECAGKLASTGKLDETVAVQIRQAAYQDLVQNDPNCPVISAVRQKLSTLAQ